MKGPEAAAPAAASAFLLQGHHPPHEFVAVTLQSSSAVGLFFVNNMTIRPARAGDFDAMCAIFQAVVATGTTYAFAPDTSRDEGLAYFVGPEIACWVVEDEGRVVGMYKLVSNRPGLGSHVANASFMVDPHHAGHGVGTLMGRHCLREARRAGFLSIQFNFVVSTNTPAVTLWKKLGFQIVGTLPKAFNHREHGLVDAYVMYRFLDDIDADEALEGRV